MQVDRPGMHHQVGGVEPDGAEHPSGGLLDDVDRACASVLRRLIRSTARCGAVQNQPSGRRRSSPRSVSRCDQGPGAGPEPALVARPQRQLLRGGRQLRTQHRPGSPDRARWSRPAGRTGPPGGPAGRRPAGWPGRSAAPRPSAAAPSGPPGLLPEGGPAARVAAQHHGVEPGDVDPELERVGRGHPADRSRPPVLARSAGGRWPDSRPVRDHARRRSTRRTGRIPPAVGPSAVARSRLSRPDRCLGRPRHLLGQPPRRDEGEHLLAGPDPGGHQLGGGGLRRQLRARPG